MILLSIIFFIFIAIATAVCAIAFYGRYRQLEKQVSAMIKKNLILEQEVKALLNADITFGRAIQVFKNDMGLLEDKMNILETQRNNDGGYPYALKLLQAGSNVDEIIEECQLSRPEAELLSNLHAYKSTLSN